MRLSALKNNVESARVDVARAREHLNSARRTLEHYETMLQAERDKFRDIADTVFDQHK